MRRAPRYPIYVPTKGRFKNPLTINFLLKDDVPFRAVVEQEQYDDYAKKVPEDRLLVLPESGKGLVYARNWIMTHSIAEGHARHWQLDDNIGYVSRLHEGRRIRCNSGPAIAWAEDFTDAFTNVALTGIAYRFFAYPWILPFFVNCHVYSFTLVNNAIEQRWRLLYNDDTDLCLQVLASGWCTIQVNTFCCDKKQTMTVRGGNTDDLYQGDGRLVMARSLERMWPGVVSVDRRFQRPQHIVAQQWKRFDTELQFREGLGPEDIPNIDDYGLRLRQVAPIRSERLRDYYETKTGETAVAEEPTKE